MLLGLRARNVFELHTEFHFWDVTGRVGNRIGRED